MRHKTLCKYIPWLCCLLFCLPGRGLALDSGGASLFEREQLKIKYSLAGTTTYDKGVLELSKGFAEEEPPEFARSQGYKSPGKAFFLSLAVPGLGQYYYGSKIKPVLFFGAEVATWAYHIKWNNEGDDITDEFEAFNRAHWSRDSYEQEYLFYAYGVTSDRDVPPGTTEVSHHLPDTRTQQYYEMTGKYDQFSWGWDDAMLDGQVLGPGVEPVTGDATTPYSANRVHYETRRNDANNSYDRATRMVFVSIANRIFSAFEALFTTKSINKKQGQSNGEFSRIKMSAKLKSYYTKRDTPYITVSYKF